MKFEKPEGKSAGIAFKAPFPGKAVVDKVLPGGLLEEYNQAYPATAVQEGDTILSLNGTTGNGLDIVAKFTQTIGTIEFKLERIVRAEPATQSILTYLTYCARN